MVFLTVVLLICFLNHPVFAGQKQFIEQWKKYDEQIQVSYDLGRFLERRVRADFNSLRKYTGLVVTPPELEGKTGEAFLLYAQQNFQVVLVTPKNLLEGDTTLSRELEQAIAKCEEDNSWIVLLPENAWTEVDLNPYCTMDYDEDDIYFDLYWTGSAARPLVDIVTNGLTCVPHHLFRWDRRTGAYTPAAFKCSGQRTFEGYSGTGMQYEQMY